MRITGAGMLLVVFAFASCIYQNSPLEPNRSPTIRSYTPQLTFVSLTVPESCMFSIRAEDPDGDDLAYSFSIGDSLLGIGDSARYYASSPGEYVIRGEARDGTTKAYHEWRVTVLEKDNLSPVITWYAPDQRQVACVVGEMLEFSFKASDDHPASLAYSYLLDGAPLYSGSPSLINRFLHRGDFVLEGVVWDGQYGDTIRWDISVTGFPDTIPPAAIIDLAGGPGDVDGSVSLEWTAPGDDGNVGKAASYVVKTAVYPIVTEEDWLRAEGKPGEPVPSAAGTREQMKIRNLVSANYVYVAMRAVDDFFNVSPIGNCSRILVRGIDIGGRAVNPVTSEPVAGIVVSAGSRADTTDAEGTYLLRNVPSYSTGVVARDESVQGQLGDYFDCVYPLTHITQLMEMDFYMIPAFQLVNTVEPDAYQGHFLMLFKELTETDGYLGRSTVYKGWKHAPISLYNPPMTLWIAELHQSFDLQAACTRALTDWEELTGIDIFVEVPSPEGADVTVNYDTVAVQRHTVKTPEVNPDGTPARKELWIFTKNTELPIYSFADLVFAHELGHVLGLSHSRNRGHLMVGLTTPPGMHPTTDEVRVVKALYHIPNFFDYKSIIEE